MPAKPAAKMAQLPFSMPNTSPLIQPMRPIAMTVAAAEPTKGHGLGGRMW
jgi:hypothetical protein